MYNNIPSKNGKNYFIKSITCQILKLLNILIAAFNLLIHRKKVYKRIKAMDIKKLRIQFFRTGVRNDLEEFKYHVSGVENYLSLEVKDLVNRHEQATENLTEDEKNEYYEFYSDDYWQLAEVFPQIQRKSELVGIYTVLEHNLNLLCSIYQRHTDSKVKLSDLKAQGIIDTARKYLVKVVGLDFPSDHRSWAEIKKIQRIRNLFVHNDGKLKGTDNDKRPIKDYISNSNYLELGQYERIIINSGFTIYCLDQFREFFDELFKSVEAFEETI